MSDLRVSERPVATGRLVMAGFAALSIEEAHARLLALGFALERHEADWHGAPFYRTAASAPDDLVLRENGTEAQPLEPEHADHRVLLYVNAAVHWEHLLALLAGLDGLALLSDEAF